MATRFDWGGESTPQRNERAKESASDFEASPDALTASFRAVRAFPSPSRPATEERRRFEPCLARQGSAETASVRDESDEPRSPGNPLLRAEDVSARFGTAVVEVPTRRPSSDRLPCAVREPRQKPTAPVSRRRRVNRGASRNRGPRARRTRRDRHDRLAHGGAAIGSRLGRSDRDVEARRRAVSRRW
jgi:hypothetical protein